MLASRAEPVLPSLARGDTLIEIVVINRSRTPASEPARSGPPATSAFTANPLMMPVQFAEPCVDNCRRSQPAEIAGNALSQLCCEIVTQLLRRIGGRGGGEGAAVDVGVGVAHRKRGRSEQFQVGHGFDRDGERHASETAVLLHDAN